MTQESSEERKKTPERIPPPVPAQPRGPNKTTPEHLLSCLETPIVLKFEHHVLLALPAHPVQNHIPAIWGCHHLSLGTDKRFVSEKGTSLLH